MPELVTQQRKVAHYGWKPALPIYGEASANIGGLQVRAEVDPRGELPPVENQWALGSCTSNATASCFRYDSILDGHDPGQLCRLWIYYGERKLEGDLGKGDTGALGHDAFTVARAGIPPETTWPYDWPGIDQDQPPAASIFDPPSPPAAAVAADTYYTLTKQVVTVPQNEQAIKAVLSNNQSVALGFSVYESFESPEVAKTGVLPMPAQGERMVGGHEVLAVGYLSSEPHHVLVMNSWGTGWGLAGFFLMPWSYITNSQLVRDLRTIVRPL